jgi:hypothetical protein
VAKQIADSAVTITVRAITEDASKQARRAAKEERVKEKALAQWNEENLEDEVRSDAEDEAEIEGLDGEDRDMLIRRRIVEARRTYVNQHMMKAVSEHLLTRLVVKPKMTIEQVRSLSEQIGIQQRDRLFDLWKEAAGEMRPPSAPFSQSSSPARSGGTSSKRSGQRGRGQSRR